MNRNSKINNKSKSSTTTPLRKSKKSSLNSSTRNNKRGNTRTRKTPIFNWVHLSDIHFQANNNDFANTQIRTGLPDSLAKIFKKKKCDCDAIFIAGDFRYAPKKTETKPQDVIDYVKQITKALKLSDDKVVIVPGNHDLDRNVTRDAILDRVKKTYKSDRGIINIELLSNLTKNFGFYKSIQAVFKNGLNYNENIISNPHGIIELDKCTIILLNTALIAGRQKGEEESEDSNQERDEHQLIIGTSYLDSLLKKRIHNKPIIVIGHHGLDMLQDEEKEIVSQILITQGANLYLCGHAHIILNHSYGKQNQRHPGQEIVVGCLSQGHKVTAGFSVGTLYSNGDVKIEMHRWNNDLQTPSWYLDKQQSTTFTKLLHFNYNSQQPLTPQPVEWADFGISLVGSSPIGDDEDDGIKYVWKKHVDSNENDSQHELYLESVINNRRFLIPSEDKEQEKEDENTSRYKISTSIGCPLQAFDRECVFCEVGTNKYYPLTADEIALQCIFMAEYDSLCTEHFDVMVKQREFAFMGQGEPGFNYPMVKRAILLTDLAMKEINQKVSGYIIYTSGITDFIPSLIDDYKNGIFNKSNLHVKVYFSLNAIEERDSMMPINKIYPYQDFIEQCKALYQVTKEKIEVGILMMSEYTTTKGLKFSLNPEKFEAILNELDKDTFSIDLCFVNKTIMGKQSSLDYEEYGSKVESLLKIAKDNGFTCKLFKDFGAEYNAACGQITSSEEEINGLHPPGKSQTHYSVALEMLEKAKEKLYNMSTNID